MFNNAVVLDSQQHGDLTYTPAEDFSWTKDLLTAPLAPMEIQEASLYYPIFFSATGPVTALAVFGLGTQNVFLDSQNKWTADYLPAHVRRYPFILAKVEGQEDYLVAADMDAPQLSGKKGQPLFAKEGGLNAYFDPALTLLREFQKNLDAGREAFAELESTGVLVAKNITIKNDKEAQMIGGFRIVDINKVNALDDATLARWTRNGVMEIIFHHRASLRHLNAVGQATARPQQVQ